MKMENLPALISLITFSCLLYCVNSGQSLGCPFNQSPADEIKEFNLTYTDILNGDILMNKNPQKLKELCSQTSKAKGFGNILKSLNMALDNCNYGHTKPHAAAFNPKGVKDALQYLCKNVQVFVDNFDCFNSSQEALKNCRDEQMALANKENKTPLENICSTQRIHSFFANTVLRSQCNNAIADFKKTIGEKILSPRCSCPRKVMRMPKGEMLDECFSTSCIHDGMGYVKEVSVSEGIVFGLRSSATIEEACVQVDAPRQTRSSSDGKSYKLASEINACLARDCGYRFKDYKLQLINQTGMEAAATYICENRNYMMGTQESRRIIDDLLGKALTCQIEKWKNEEDRLDEMNKYDDMNEMVCSKHRLTKQCIKDTFNCATCETIRKHLLQAWDLRQPSLCEKCQAVGYMPVETTTTSKSTTKSAATIVVQSIFVLLAGLFLTLFNF